MSERGMRAVLAAAIVVACAFGAARAQAQTYDARQMLESLEKRIDSLRAEYARDIAVINRIDSLQAERAHRIVTDTVAVGPFLLIDRSSVSLEPGTAVMRDAWSKYAPLVGFAAEKLQGAIVTQTLPRSFIAGQTGMRMYDLHSFGGGRDEYAAAADRVVRSAMADALPDDVRDWLDGAGLVWGGLDWAYRSLATSYSSAGGGCYEGDVTSCRSALGLTDPGDDWSAWYTPEQLRDMVALDRRPRLTGWEECVEHRRHDECVGILRVRGPVQPPVPVAVRSTVLAHALTLGGAGSFERLLADAPDVESRLANAARRPMEDVVRSWHGAVVDARPDMHAGVVRAGFWTVVWLAGLALLAMRSTRWRLG